MTGAGRPPTTVLVVADSAVTAARIEAVLRTDRALRPVVGDASTLATLAAEGEAAIVILATSAPQAATRELERLRGLRRPPAVVLLTPSPQAAWTARARRAGVRAVLGRDATAEEILAAVAATRAGLLVLHPDALGAPPAAARRRGGPAALTSRELEILEMMAEGMSNRSIAARLKISRNTVKFHVASVLTKLGARGRTEAVTAGVRQGLISL